MNDKIKELKSYIQHLEKMLIGYKEVCKKKDETIDYYKTELDRLKLRNSQLIGLPTNDNIHQNALNYITRNGTIDNAGLRDEVFIAYKSGCYWMRKIKFIKQ